MIVDLLIRDGRMSAADIAREIGNVTERIVRYRIERMRATGLIRVSAIVNPARLGYTVAADVWLEVESDAIPETARQAAAFENVTYVACSIGEKDISVQVVGRDTTEVYSFITEVLRKLPGVRKTTTSIVPIVVKDVYQWSIPGKNVRNTIKRKIGA